MKRYIIVDIALLLILIKVIWVSLAMNGYENTETEKDDIFKRRDWLLDKVSVPPGDLLNMMPHSIGLQFQGEWALYSCSMLTQALANIAFIYPETKDESINNIDSLISIVLSPELRQYDTVRWGEDPLKTLKGNNSHISYISHLAWMIGNYKSLGGGAKYDTLYHDLCKTMNRRIMQSPNLNLPTYPDEPIYIPDMLVAIVALHKNGNYNSTVKEWLKRAKAEWIDEETGLLMSFLYNDAPVKGSYTALNCYYLTLIDEHFAREQYALMRRYFYRGGLLPGIKEYATRSPLFEEDIDAGVILFGLSPSATAFAIGSATFFSDDATRIALLRTAEIVGHTVKKDNKRHYLLADIVLVGEAIALAMRTNYPTNTEHQNKSF